MFCYLIVKSTVNVVPPPSLLTWPGKIKDKCEKAGFYERLSLIEKQFKGTAVLLHKLGYLPPGFRQLWANQRLLNAVEQFIGPDIAGAVQLANVV